MVTPAPAAPWSSSSFEPLDTCHRETQQVLQLFDALVRRVVAEGADEQARAMATTIEQHFNQNMRRHHEDEEKHVFPQLAALGDPDLCQVVDRLVQDHAWIEADWNELQPQLDAIACGQSWFDVELLRNGVEVMGQLFREHIELEEALIYPQARMNMTPQQLAAMDDEMKARRRAHEERHAGRRSRDRATAA